MAPYARVVHGRRKKPSARMTQLLKASPSQSLKIHNPTIPNRGQEAIPSRMVHATACPSQEELVSAR
jgi:hypothetical protein